MAIKFLFGADPEVFVKDKNSNKFVSAHGMSEGTKENPQLVQDGAIQVDGMALEFNINPASTQKEFIDNIASVRAQMSEIVGEGFSLESTPSVRFSQDVWENAPDDAKLLGCDPDYNAYTMQQNPVPEGDGTLRTGAGHIHIGWTEDVDPHHPDHMEACQWVTKQLDVAIGLQSLFWDKDKERRTLYGKAGAFRPKPYGVEYRVLSNKWLKSKRLQRQVYSVVKHALKDLERGNIYYNMCDARSIINFSDNYGALRNLRRAKFSYILPLVDEVG